MEENAVRRSRSELERSEQHLTVELAETNWALPRFRNWNEVSNASKSVLRPPPKFHGQAEAENLGLREDLDSRVCASQKTI
jgi:hypothetical protein